MLDQKLGFLFGLLLLTDGECGDQPSLLEPEADKVVIRQSAADDELAVAAEIAEDLERQAEDLAEEGRDRVVPQSPSREFERRRSPSSRWGRDPIASWHRRLDDS